MMNKLYDRIRKRATGVPRVVAAFALLAFIALPVRGQAASLDGIVLSHRGKPVSNVSVSIEGSTQLPVLTDEKGAFTLDDVSPSDWLLIAPTGKYHPKRVFVNGRRTVTIYLTPLEMISGNQQLIILEQPMRRKDLVASVSDPDIRKYRHTSAVTFDQFLQGRVGGLYVVNRSGMPASGSVMNIRGINSLYASNQPLIVIDGVPLASLGVFNSVLEGFDYNPLTNINPFDISEISVVKDPLITATYGSKASNGAIFIQTLKPTVTQTTIEVDYRNGFSLSPSNLIPQMTATQHKTLISEILVSSGVQEEELLEMYPGLYLEEDDLDYINYQHNTNWQEIIFNNALYTNINLHVKGGDEIARYGLSVGYTNSDGVIKTTNYQGYSLRFVSLLNIFTWLKMNAGVSLNYNTSTLKEAATVDETSPILTSLAKSPMLYPFKYDLAGKEILELSEVDELGISNPQAVIDNYSADNSNYNFTATLGLDGRLSDNLFLRSKFNLTYNVLKERIFMPNRGMELYYDREAFNVAKASNNDINSLFNNTFLTCTKRFGTNHMLTSNTGVNVQSNRYQFDWGLTKNAHENDEYRMIQDGLNDQREIGGANRNWNWISFYEYVTYSFMDRYLLSGAVSLDGSSRVGDNALNTLSIAAQPFGLFYSGGAAWRISRESFLKDAAWLEELKLRVSVGKTGNDDIGESSATNYYESVKFRETVGLYPASIPNDSLSYETVSQLSAGMDIGILGNRLRATFDVYRSVTDNMLIYSPIESFMGYDLRLENGGRMVNSGWEFSGYVRVLETGSFRWDVAANLSSFSNRVLEIKGDELSYPVPGGEKINKVGESANSFYGFRYIDVFHSSAEAEAAGLVNDKGMPFGAGDVLFEDISGPEGEPDMVIDAYDKTTIGSPLPELFGGITNTLSYGRFSLSLMMQFVYGNEVFNYVRYKNESMTGLSNQSTTVLDRWQYEYQDTEIPKANWKDPMGNAAFSTRWIEDGSYVRVKNITLAYTVPDKFLAFRNAEFYVSANNLLTFSNYLGYDPEFAYSHSMVFQGIDYGLTPQVRQFIAGVKLGF